MTMDRISRGTPIKATKSEQEAFLSMLERDDALRKDIETSMGISLLAMSPGQKLGALEDYFLAGKTFAAVNATTRAKLEAHTLAEQSRSHSTPSQPASPSREDAA